MTTLLLNYLKLFFLSLFFFSFPIMASEVEPNESCAAANLLLDTSSSVDSGYVNGTVDDSSDNDYFKIILTQRAEIRLDKHDRNNKKTRAKVLEDDCSTSLGSTNSKDKTNWKFLLDAGTYYIHFYRSNANNAQYKIKAKMNRVVDFVVSKSVDNATPSVGDTITYTITTINNGPSGSKVHIMDALPSGLTFVSENGSGCSKSGNGMDCKKWLNNGSTFEVELKASVDSGVSGLLKNTVNIEKDITNSNGDKTFETDLTNNSAFVDITVASNAVPPPVPSDETIPNTTSTDNSATCGTFEDGLQTRANNSTVNFSGGSGKLFNNPDAGLNTYTTPVNGGSGNDITCNDNLDGSVDQSCGANGAGAMIIDPFTMLYPQTYTFVTPFDTSSGNTIIVGNVGWGDDYNSGTSLEDFVYNRVSAHGGVSPNYLNFKVTNLLKLDTLSTQVGNEVTFTSKTGDIFELQLKNVTTSTNNTFTADTNIKNIKMDRVTFGNDATVSLKATQTIKINTLTTSHSTTLSLEAEYININSFTDISGAGQANTITIKADYIDIGSFDVGDVTTLNIIPFTAGKKVVVKMNTFHTGSKNIINFNEGDYYIKTLNTQGSGNGYQWNMDAGNRVNLFLEDDYTTESEIAINADGTGGTNLCADSHNALDLFIFTKGNLIVKNDSRLVATIYSEQDVALNSASYIKGAISANNSISLGNGTEVCYDQNIATDGYGTCSDLTIGFDKEIYQVSEDYTIADGLSSPVAVKIELSAVTTTDVSVTYTTRDGTALAGQDYKATTETVTIPAGSTETLVYIDIYHDVEIELDESFYIDLSDIVPSDGSVAEGIFSAEVIILEQTAENLPVCYSDNFEGTLDDKWRTLRSRGGFTPHIVNGRLRLTDGSTNLATAVTKDFEFSSRGNMIVAEFEQFAYGGCGSTHGGSGVDGADGIVLVLFNSEKADGTTNDSPVPGGSGGSIGYAQYSAGTPGFEGGWLGLGIDEYGNFANCNEERIGGLPGTSCDSGSGFSAQSHRNIASIRGDGSGMNGYEFLAASAELSPKVANKSSATPSRGDKYRFTTDARDDAHLYITLERDINDGNGYQVIINKFDAKDPIYNQTTTPDKVRFAFTSGTGGGCNNHEIDELIVKGVCRAYNPNPPATVANAADIVNGFTTKDTYNFGTKHITTKVAGKIETITAVHLDDNGNAATFVSANTLPFKILPYLANSDCSSRTLLYKVDGTPAIIDISNGQITKDIDVVMPSRVIKDARFSIAALDYQELYDNYTQACFLNSSTTANLAGMNSCANSASQYQLSFGAEAYQRCIVDNGAPCTPAHNGVGNAPYDNEYGCVMCTMDQNSTCSSDNFALRPDAFKIFGKNQYKQAGEDFNITIKAVDEGNNSINVGTLSSISGVPDYNASTAASKLSIVSHFYTPSASDITQMQTDTGLNNVTLCPQVGTFTRNAPNFSNGVVDMTLKFSETGILDINVSEVVGQEFALVDENDTAVSKRLITSTSDILDIYDISQHDLLLFVPYTLQTAITYDVPGGGNWLYMNTLNSPVDARQMAASASYTITAKNKDGNVTQNFTASCFPDTDEVNCPRVNGLKLNTTFDLFLDLDLNSSAAVTVNFYADDNNSNAIWTPQPNKALAIGKNSVQEWISPLSFSNGVGKAKVYFNMNRILTQARNPVTISILDANTSTSWMANPGSPKNFTGAVINSSKNFIYGRTHAPRQKYIDSETVVNHDAFIYYESYCSDIDAINVTCSKSLLPDGVGSTFSDDPRWFINTQHTVVDGNASNVTEKRVSGIVNIITQPTGTHQDKVVVRYPETNNKGYPYVTTMQNDASSWLIYNKFDAGATKNEFSLEFYRNAGGYVGFGKSTNDTNVQHSDSASTNENKSWW